MAPVHEPNHRRACRDHIEIATRRDLIIVEMTAECEQFADLEQLCAEIAHGLPAGATDHGWRYDFKWNAAARKNTPM